MDKYSNLLKQVSFPSRSEEYNKLILTHLEITGDEGDEAISGGQSKKFSNIIRFRFKDAIIATIEFVAKFPNENGDLVGFVLGLWEFVRKLNEYATRTLSPNELMVVSYAAVIYRDSAFCDWPSEDDLRKRLPRSLSDDEFHDACAGLLKLNAIQLNSGRVAVTEYIDILEE